jgi:adenylate cyclase
MTTEDFKRKLRGILSADVVGYSRLLRENEASTIRNLEENRKLIFKLAEESEGCVVDTPGDNILAEFSSVIKAVKCALKIQQELSKKNSKLLENQRAEYRIGINLGDVVVVDGRIYGSGVNIAARLEGLAEPAGIYISRRVFDHVKGKLEIGYEYLGEHNVKNISEPIRVYRVLTDPESTGKVIGEEKPNRSFFRVAMAGIIILYIAIVGSIGWNTYFQQFRKVEPSSSDRMAYRFPDKPSIVVLPFENLSGDPDKKYFSDGLTEEIITGLSKNPQLFVISRNSSFIYKNKPVKVQQVSEELGVRYVLEGSVKRQGNRIRITVQLIDAVEGNHIWSRSYDREMEDILALQSEIMWQIYRELQIKFTDGEMARDYLWTEKVNVEYYETLLLASQCMDAKEWVRAIQLADKLIEMDPNEPFGYYAKGYILFYRSYSESGESKQKSLELAKEYGQKSLPNG